MTREALPADRRRLRELRGELDRALADALGGRRRVVVLDAPVHRNAGDLLILRGTLDAVARLGVRVASIQGSSLTSWDRLRRLPGDIAVLLHGGGNFGGLYPVRDEYRGRVLEVVPSAAQVIVMPQSVHFPTPRDAQRVRQMYAPYAAATFMVRDSASFSRLAATVPELAGSLRKVPDAAFGTRDWKGSGHPDHGLLVLRRRDKESTGVDLDDLSARLGGTTTDWPTFDRDSLPFRILRKASSMSPNHSEDRAQRVMGALGDPVLRWHTSDQVRQLRRCISSGRVLVTDRLHAHVAASLMGIPNVVLNNSDGKVEAIVRDWTHDLSTTHFVSSIDEALITARGLLSKYHGTTTSSRGGSEFPGH